MSSLEDQKALLFAAKGIPFTVGTRPIPKPGPGQILVKIHSAALNPADNYIQSLGIFVEEWPFVAGSDAAGVVEAIGENVQGLKKGDRVLYQSLFTPDRGTFQQYGIADGIRAAKIPPNVTFEGASTLPLGLATASIGLYAKKSSRGGAGLFPPWEEGGRGKYKGQPILVIGGASSVGQFTIQLAKLSGFSPIITTCSAHSAAYCVAAGATHTIDYYTTPYSELSSAVRAIVGPSTSISVIYDAISIPESQRACWDILAPKGSIVMVATPVVAKAGEEAEDGKRAVWVYGNVNHPDYQEFGAALYSKLTALLEEEAIKPNNIDVLPDGLAGIPDGLKRLLGGISGVKLVAHPQETL